LARIVSADLAGDEGLGAGIVLGEMSMDGLQVGE
jgi:hypothetical protein